MLYIHRPETGWMEPIRVTNVSPIGFGTNGPLVTQTVSELPFTPWIMPLHGGEAHFYNSPIEINENSRLIEIQFTKL